MLQAEFVNRIAEHSGFTKKDSLYILQEIGQVLQDLMVEGEEVAIPHFGKFIPVERKAKIGRNPKQPEVDIEIPAHMVTTFRMKKELKEAQNR